jgi:hypothetical protein
MSPEGRKTSREALSLTLDSVSSEPEGYHRSSTKEARRGFLADATDKRELML